MADQVLDETKLQTETISPFLPGTNIQYAWDSTSLGLIKTCGRLYQYTMIDGWVTRDESIHLRFGIEYHAALEHFDRLVASGTRRDDSLQQVVRTVLERTVGWTPDQNTKAGKYKNRETLIGLIIDYIDHFNPDPAETYIKSDGTPAVELSFRYELEYGPSICGESHGSPELDADAKYLQSMGVDPGPTWPRQPYLLCGHIDRVVTFNDQLFVMDRKTTTTTLSGYYFAQYEPHNQMTLYTLAGRIILNSPIRGVIIDAAQVMLEKPNAFARGFTYRTEDQLTEWLDDLRMTLQLSEQYATMSYWPMNDTSCDRFGGCKFRGICSKSASVRHAFLKSDFIKQEPDERWNPLKPR
jgi:hypothetical protein